MIQQEVVLEAIPMPETELSVEEALARLEQIVQSLEEEDVSLEKSLALFEEGVRLADLLKRRLEEGELRVKKVLQSTEGFRLEDFEI
jgi:exodeoxyribonuclease VII small subunit